MHKLKLKVIDLLQVNQLKNVMEVEETGGFNRFLDKHRSDLA